MRKCTLSCSLYFFIFHHIHSLFLSLSLSLSLSRLSVCNDIDLFNRRLMQKQENIFPTITSMRTKELVVLMFRHFLPLDDALCRYCSIVYSELDAVSTSIL